MVALRLPVGAILAVSACSMRALEIAAITLATALAGCSQDTVVRPDGNGGLDGSQDASSDDRRLQDAPADTGAGDASSIACGARVCGPSELCLHVCDCCGIPTFDGGPQPSGHEECVPDTGQCASGSGSFYSAGRWCSCLGRAHEADCPCA